MRWRVICLGLSLLSACHARQFVIGRFIDDHCADYPDALVCSGFEQQGLADWPKISVQNEGEIERSGARAFTGLGSLHARTTAAQSAAVLVHEFPAVRDGELYLRARLYVPADLPTKTINLFFLGDFAAPDPFVGIDVNLEDGAPSVYSPQINPNRSTSSNLVVPRDAWFCLLLHVSVSNEAGAVRVYVNDTLALQREAVDTLPEQGLHQLRAGIDWSSGQAEPFEVFIDDLLLDTQALRCD
jgi:hypothetical protein